MSHVIEELDGPAAAAAVPELAGVLRACVLAGASVSFVLPFPEAEAVAFWRRIAAAVAAGERRLLVARDAGRILGTVQLDLATPPNQPHRAEVQKLLVHPDARRRGIARDLMRRVEAVAAAAGRHLLTLDTLQGSGAEPLYRALGYVEVGSIPGYALLPDVPRAEPTVIFYRQLTAA